MHPTNFSHRGGPSHAATGPLEPQPASGRPKGPNHITLCMSERTPYARTELTHFLGGVGAPFPCRELPGGGARVCMGRESIVPSFAGSSHRLLPLMSRNSSVNFAWFSCLCSGIQRTTVFCSLSRSVKETRLVPKPPCLGGVGTHRVKARGLRPLGLTDKMGATCVDLVKIRLRRHWDDTMEPLAEYYQVDQLCPLIADHGEGTVPHKVIISLCAVYPGVMGDQAAHVLQYWGLHCVGDAIPLDIFTYRPGGPLVDLRFPRVDPKAFLHHAQSYKPHAPLD